MDWQDSGIILKTLPHGEGKAVVTVFTQNHGRHLGYIRGTRKLNAILQPGSLVHCRWQARLSDQLGSWSLEGKQAYYPHVLQDPAKLCALQAACSWIDLTLAEREDHLLLYEQFVAYLETLKDPNNLQQFVFFELCLLKELGFGLDLRHCTVSGAVDDLIFVSPRTGKAVCREVGEPYKEKLLKLPKFLVESCQDVSPEDMIGGLELTGYFLERFVLTQINKPVPSARQRLLDVLRKRKKNDESTRYVPRCSTG